MGLSSEKNADFGYSLEIAMQKSRIIHLQIPTAEAMHELGRRMGQELKPGDFIGLSGGLGAGKTVLVQGICEACGIDPREILSPTFTIVASHSGRFRIHHADFYRLGDVDELYATGFDDLVNDESAVLVEWIDQVPEAFPPEAVKIFIDGCGDGIRKVSMEFIGNRFDGRFCGLESVPPAT